MMKDKKYPSLAELKAAGVPSGRDLYHAAERERLARVKARRRARQDRFLALVGRLAQHARDDDAGRRQQRRDVLRPQREQAGGDRVAGGLAPGRDQQVRTAPEPQPPGWGGLIVTPSRLR